MLSSEYLQSHQLSHSSTRHKTRTRSYIVVATKNIRQIPSPMLDHDFIAGLLAALEVYCLEIVGECFGGRVGHVAGVGVEVEGRVE